jgi:hypothetical protein
MLKKQIQDREGEGSHFETMPWRERIKNLRSCHFLGTLSWDSLPTVGALLSHFTLFYLRNSPALYFPKNKIKKLKVDRIDFVRVQ